MERIDRCTSALDLCSSGVVLPHVVLILFDVVKVDCGYIYIYL